MITERKIIIAVTIVTALILGGGIVFLGSSSKGTLGAKTALQKTAGAKIEVRERKFDFKDIPYSGGNVTHEYWIKNSGDQELKVANLKTSCMCTKTYLKTAKEKGPEFGMQGHASGGASDWIGKLLPGEEGQIMAVFDPTAHGPEGVGPVSRFVSFETNDPDHPYIELEFSGVVVK